MLKVIAIVTMIIDHIGYYFEGYMPNFIYLILRAVGRVSMPLFAFLIVQGFFHTSDLRKYILRLFSLGVITQALIFMVSRFDSNAYNLSVNKQLNVVFSYTLSLITIWLIHEKVIIKKFNYNQNMFAKIILLMVILGIYLFIPFDYGVYVPLLIIMFYFIERLKISIYLQRQDYNMSVKKVVYSMITEEHIKLGYIALMVIAILIIIIQSANPLYWYMLLSIIPIYLYNGERGKKNKLIKWSLYLVFPSQHFLLYLLSVVI